MECHEKRTRAVKILWVLLVILIFIGMMASIGLLFYSYHRRIPSNLYVRARDEQKIRFDMPATGMVKATSSAQKSNVPQGVVAVNLSGTVTMRTGHQEDYDMEVRLFGILPIKNVNIHVIDNRYLIPMGTPVGIYMKSNGVLVIGAAEFESMSGEMVAPAKNLLQSGDYVVAVNGKQVNGKKELMEEIAGCDGRNILLTVRRDGEERDVVMKPEQNVSGQYKAGIWVRDNLQGVGTLTYLDEDGKFGALGHGITDGDTGVMLEVKDGVLYQTEIVNLRKGENGNPGELTGRIVYDDSFVIGTIEKNTQRGIFGEYQEKIREMVTEQAVPIGLKQEIELGKAQIISTIDDKPQKYEVEITGVHPDHDNVNRGIELKITDPELLRDTGGIIQGMSGSPILQNGKIIGAVTHVLVNDPGRGYGIFIENMLEEAGR